MEISVNNKFVLHSSNGHDYRIEVVNINFFRPPDMVYAIDVWDDNNIYMGDVQFVGEDFFTNNKVERI